MNKIEQKELLDSIGELLDKKLEVKFNEVQIELSEMKKQTAKIPEIEKQVAKIPEIEKQVAKIPEMQKEIAKISEIQKEIAKIPEIQKEMRSISGSVAVIEHEHGDKIKALFDAFIVNNEKIQTEEQRILFCERKIENHDIEIEYLKTKIQGL